ncbi:MAG: PrsW family glutamic-type intramembrane protease [Lachnospiraceae bacterium]|nr:PrsW family glutamic-type intramembrane protease [Lachnospiraceae bacterium]
MNEEMKIRRRRRIVICILVLLFAIGLAYNEADFIGKKTTSTLQYLEVYSAFLPLLIYIVPFVLIMKQLSDKYEIKGTKLLIAAFSGAFIPAALASQINGSFDDLMKSLMGHSYTEDWLGSLEAGIAEELLKLLTTAMLLYVFRRKSLKDYLMFGMSVGIGFQVEEDLSYITESGFGKLKDAFPTALDRVSSSLGSHWTYAAVTAAGLYLILRSTGRNHKRRGIGWILFVIADHFLYDTPIGDINLFNAILQAAVVIPLIVFFTSPEMKAEERTLLSAGKKE